MKGFRVWSNYWKKYATEAELYMDGSADAVFEDDDGVPHHENTDLVLEFGTGLKDKNGKEIHDGDIVREVVYTCLENIDGEYEYIVQWSDKFREFVIQTTKKNKTFFHDELYQLNMSREVIGNVHENPELLEEKK